MKSPSRIFAFLTLATAFTLGCAFFGEVMESLSGAPAIVETVEVAPTAFADDSSPTGPTLQGDVDLAELFSPVWESRDYLQEYFVEQPVEDAVLAQGALDGLVSFVNEQELELDEILASEDAPRAQSLAEEAETPADTNGAFDDFWKAWRTIQFGDAELEGTYEDLMHAALSSMVEALGDPHTAFMDPNQVQQSNIQLEGEYDGIGAFVDTTTEFVTIVAPMEGSPAEQAGLKPGDMVIAVDGEDMAGIPGEAVINRILGPAGSQVVLTILREEEPEPFDVEVVRAHINVPSVQGEILEGNIAYVQLLTFGANSATELHDKLEVLFAENPRGLILDLRNNGGGFLNTAVAITSEFLTGGVVLYEEYGDGTRDDYSAFSGGIATEIYLVVLVNEGTASASEILAGAIQDYERGLLVGQTTFGKGSVQQPVALSNDQGALRITVAHWLTPDERLIHGVGLTPDVAVELTDEDFENELDPQLDAAIDLINENAATTSVQD